MPVFDQQIRDSLIAARDQMTLAQPEDVALHHVHQRAATAPVRRTRRRWLIPAGAAAIVGIGASVAVAVTVSNDGSSAAFRNLHPDKSQIGSTMDEPHVLLGNLPAAAGQTLRAYVTTRPGTSNCALVETVTSGGTQIDSISYCTVEPAGQAELHLVNGALIGWVPNHAVTTVKVSGDGYSSTAAVLSQHFLAPAAPAGSTETVRGLNAAGKVTAVWAASVR